MLFANSFDHRRLKEVSGSCIVCSGESLYDFYCNLSNQEVVFLGSEGKPKAYNHCIPKHIKFKITTCVTSQKYEAAVRSISSGDHAALLFESDGQSFRLIRDAFGVFPLFYYHQPDSVFAVSDNIAELVRFLVANQRPVAVNEEKLLAYLKTGIVNVPYSNDTFFAGVHTVLPGYRISVSAKSVTAERTLSFDVTKWKASCVDIDDFGNTFRELFQHRVNQLVQDKKKVGVTLSGGLDSSTVASLVRRGLPKVPMVGFFSYDPRNAALREAKDHDEYYSREVSRHLGIELEVINRGNERLPDIEKALRLVYQPPLMMGSYTPFFEMLERMEKSGIDILVTGNDGDTVVGYGTGYLSQLFKEENWEEISSVLVNHPRAKLKPDFREKYLQELIYSEVRELVFSKQLLRAARLLFASCGGLKVSLFRMVGIMASRTMGKLMRSSYRGSPIVLKEAEERVVRRPVINSLTGLPPDQKPYFQRMIHNHNVRLVEEYYALSKHYHIDVRFPFFSRELYELCLAVPDKLNYAGGLGRGVMRHCMKGILLDSVRLRTNKTVGSNRTIQENVLSLVRQAEPYLREGCPIWKFVSRKNFFHNLRLIERDKVINRYSGVLQFQINRVVYCAIWLCMVEEDRKQPSSTESHLTE